MAQITLNSTGVASNGSLVLQSNGTTAAVTIDTSQRAAFVAGTAALPAITTTGDTNTGIFFPGADSVGVSTGGSERVRIDSAGNLGIGTGAITQLFANYTQLGIKGGNTTAGGTLQFVNSAGTITTNLVSDTNATYIAAVGGSGLAFSVGGSGTGTERGRFDGSGNLLVGFSSNPNTARMYVRYDGMTTQSVINSATTTSASTSWNHFIGQSGNGTSITTSNIFIRGNGNIENVNNSYGAISDVKLKENIIDASPKLEKLMQVRVRNYNFKGDYEQHKQLGVIAQELETIFPSIINETQDCDEDGKSLGTTTKSVKYSVFVPMLIKAMQEQQALITALTARITALEAN